MNNEELYQEIKNEFYSTFPNGWFGGGVSKSHCGPTENVVFDFGLIGHRDALPSRILENDPVHHKFLIYTEDDGSLESKDLQSGICINPINKYLAMSRVKTKYRKTTGDHARVLKSIKTFFGRLKVLVTENESNIYQRANYADKFFE